MERRRQMMAPSGLPAWPDELKTLYYQAEYGVYPNKTFTNWSQGEHYDSNSGFVNYGYADVPIKATKVEVTVQRENRFNTNFAITFGLKSGYSARLQPNSFFDQPRTYTYMAESLSGVAGDYIISIKIEDSNASSNDYHRWGVKCNQI